MKNVILLGANGHSSRQIIPRLLEQDDVALTLFLRQVERLKHLQSERVHMVEGDARQGDALRHALRGQDIVISTLGGMDLGDKMETLVQVMEELGVPRLIAMSAGGIYDELPEPFNAWDKSMTGETRSSNRKAAEAIERSSLRYTILRPVWLTDKAIEEFELTRKGETFKGTETSRASIGRFVANAVADPSLYVDENLGISQPDTDGDRPAAYR